MLAQHMQCRRHRVKTRDPNLERGRQACSHTKLHLPKERSGLGERGEEEDRRERGRMKKIKIIC